MLLVLAEKEDNKQNGVKVYDIIKARKDVPVELHVVKGISHYGIYQEAFDEAMKLEINWFGKHLKAHRSEWRMRPNANHATGNSGAY